MKKPLYKHLWFWLLLVVAITIVGGLASGQKGSNNAQQNSEDDVSSVEDASDTSDESEIITSTAEPESNSDTTSEVSDTPAEYRSALIKASSYANLMNMSKRGVYDQLVSENGEKFSAEAAQYAIEHVKADWNKNAVAKAKSYSDSMHLSKAGILDQLTS